MPEGSVGVVIACDDGHVVEQVAEALETSPGLFVAATSLGAARAGHVVVAAGEALVTIGEVSHPLVALAAGDVVRAARAALSAGARELVRWPDEADRLPGAIRRAAGSVGAAPGRGRVVAVFGARGGVGTSIAAAVLAASMREAIVLDLDTVSAGQRAFAPSEPARTLGDLSARLADLSPDALDAALVEHAGGARALLAEPLTEPPSVQQVHGLLRAARAGARPAVVDCGRASTPAASAAAMGADDRVMVAADDVSSIRGVRALIERGVAPTALVLRRMRRGGIPLRDLTAAIGRDPDVVFGTERRLARAADLGVLPAHPTRAMRALARLARSLEEHRGH